MTEDPEAAAAKERREFEELLLRCLELVETEGAGALAAFCAAHPEHAEQLERKVALLAGAGMLDPAAGRKLPERLGGFRLIRQLGGGGMGVVYLARQEDLGRDVALKLIRPEQLLFPGARERFHREVSTIARLQHPGIVPIYTVGEDGGVPYFAMERIAGCTLDALLRELEGSDPARLTGADLARAIRRRTPRGAGGEGGDGGEEAPRAEGAPGAEDAPGESFGYVFAGTFEQAALCIVRQVADALDHVHRRGVVHRDIKPSNVMLTPSGRAMLCDFGLSSSSGTSRLTRTGSQLGSLFYMSPEQTRSDAARVGPASDVYSLGVTLFELLSLSSAFSGDVVRDVVQDIQLGRHGRIRDVNPVVSWEAETVCLTAMEIDPARRYRSAADFSRDLGNVLDRRPIEARRASAWRRGRRWVERHPAAAVGMALGSIVLVGGPLLYAVQEKHARQRVEEQRDAALLAQRRADQNFQKALQAVDRMLTRLGDRELLNVPQMTALRRRFLEDALEFQRGFLDEKSDDPLVRKETALALQRVASINDQLGNAAEALERFGEAERMLADLVLQFPEDRAYGHALADVLRGRGLLLASMGREQETERSYARAIEILEGQLSAGSTDLEDRRLLAEMHVYLGDLLLQTRHEDALAAFEEGHALLEALVAEQPANYAYRFHRAHALSMLGILLSQASRSAAAEGSYQQAIDLWEELARENPADIQVAMFLSANFTNLAIEVRLDDPGRAVALFEEAAAVRRKLVENHPALPDARVELAQTLGNLAGVLLDEQEYERAEVALDEALTLLRALIERHPEVPEYRDTAAFVLINLGMALRGLGEPGEAERAAAEAVDLLRRLSAERPGNHAITSRLGDALLGLGLALRDQGRLDEALEANDEALEEQRRAVGLLPGYDLYRLLLRNTLTERVELLIEADRSAVARAALDEFAALLGARPDDWLKGARLFARLAAAQPDGADELLRRALACLEGAVERGFDDVKAVLSDAGLRALQDLDGFQAVAERMQRP